MTTVLFVALGTVDPAGGYRATFPDFPNCVVSASDIAQLLADARQALADHLQSVADAGEAWPTPTRIETIALTPGVIPLLVDITVEDTAVRINISLGERLLQRLDAAAQARGMSRSGFIAQAVRVSLGERGPTIDFEAATRKMQDELKTLGRRISDSIGPNSAFAQRMADLDEQVQEKVRRAADSVSAAMNRRRDAARPDPGPEDGTHPS